MGLCSNVEKLTRANRKLQTLHRLARRIAKQREAEQHARKLKGATP